MKKLALLDVDGVLLDLTPSVQEYVHNRYGYHITEDNITDWDWEYCLGFPGGIPEDFWEFMWSRPRKPYPGAIEFVRTLQALDYEVVGISARSSHPERSIDGARAAHRDFPQLGLDDYILENNKAPLVAAEYFHAVFMMEDNPNNAVDIHTESKVPMFLMNRPWNERCISVTNAWMRVKSYEEVLRKNWIRY